MNRYVYTLDLKDDPELIAEYEAYHRQVWPEVVEAVKGIGLLGDTIYRLGTRLVMILEVEDDFDPERDLQKYTEHPVAHEWDEMMKTFQQPVADAKPGEWWALMDKVFDLNDYQ